jgi:hypothetical protein
MEVSTSVIPLYTTVALPDDGWNYGPKHVVVNAINNRIHVHLWSCINRKINKLI